MCDNEKYEEFLLSDTDFLEEDIREMLPLHTAFDNTTAFEVVEQKTFIRLNKKR